MGKKTTFGSQCIVNMPICVPFLKMSDLQCGTRMVQETEDVTKHLWSSSHLCLIIEEGCLSQWWMAVHCIWKWMGLVNPEETARYVHTQPCSHSYWEEGKLPFIKSIYGRWCWGGHHLYSFWLSWTSMHKMHHWAEIWSDRFLIQCKQLHKDLWAFMW